MLHQTKRSRLAGLVVCGLVVAAVACERNVERDVKQVTITEENRAALVDEVRATNALTGEEGDLLRAYLARSDEARLPVGKTLAEVIAEQRGYASRDAAPNDRASLSAEPAAAPATEPATEPAKASQKSAPAPEGRDDAEVSASPSAPAETPEPPIIVPAGTALTVSLGHALSSKGSVAGDNFEATLGVDLEADGRLLAPKGSTLEGRVVEAISSGKVSGRARLGLALARLRIGSEAHPIKSLPLTFEAESNKGSDAKKIGIGAGAGAILGAITDGKKGALLGTVIGASAGTAVVLLTSGDEVELPAGQQLRFELLEDVELPPIR